MDFYTGKPENWPSKDDEKRDLPSPVSRTFDDPRGYEPDDGLISAVNVALTLGQPLLLTGEPGTGKTQLAYNIAKELGLPKPLKFSVKSITEARDLFYRFDHMRQFRDAHISRSENNGGGNGSVEQGDSQSDSNKQSNSNTESDDQLFKYLSMQALGLAFLRAGDPTDKNVARLLSLTDVDSALEKGKQDPNWRDIIPDPPHRTVVLIDEIDKAPRDVPNDILNEIELYEFRIPEIDPNLIVRAKSTVRPIVILTSNSEKNLPAAFLRRCIYYDIPFPWDNLNTIVANRLPEFQGSGRFLDDALGILRLLRQKPDGLADPPGTAELLAWLKAIRKCGVKPEQSLREHQNEVISTLSAVVKNSADQTKAAALFHEWIDAADQ
ncbi:MAG: MoxR family ATPase [Woeseiaceae bacterium]|nr:MoxR family ATPase [Woeseiaceae bacterium]